MTDPLEGIKQVGNEIVHRDIYGVTTRVGDKEVKRLSDGTVTIGGKPVYIERHPGDHHILSVDWQEVTDRNGFKVSREWFSDAQLGAEPEGAAREPIQASRSTGSSFNPYWLFPIGILLIIVGFVSPVTFIGSLGWLALLAAIVWTVVMAVRRPKRP